MSNVIYPAAFNRPPVHQPNPRRRKGTINLQHERRCRERIAEYRAQEARARENSAIANYLRTNDKPIPLYIAGGIRLLRTWQLLEPLGLTLKMDGDAQGFVICNADKPEATTS